MNDTALNVYKGICFCLSNSGFAASYVNYFNIQQVFKNVFLKRFAIFCFCLNPLTFKTREFKLVERHSALSFRFHADEEPLGS